MPVADPDIPLAEARRLGLAQAVGDVVHLLAARDAIEGVATDAGPVDWAGRLTDAGVGRPAEPGEPSR